MIYNQACSAAGHELKGVESFGGLRVFIVVKF